MEEIDYNKVREMYVERSHLQGDHSVLTGSNDVVSLKSDMLLDYFTKKFLLWSLKPRHNETILDFGCGVGRMSFILESRCRKVIGVDPSQELINIANSRNKFNNVEFINIDFKFRPLGITEKVDKIFTVGVMYHIPDDDLVLRLNDFAGLLNEKGKFVFIEHVSPFDRILDGVGIQRSMKKWNSLMTKSGFRICSARRIIRVPSYSISLWKKFKSTQSWLFPLMLWVEKATLNRKSVFASYYYYAFVCEKV